MTVGSRVHMARAEQWERDRVTFHMHSSHVSRLSLAIMTS